MKYLKPPYFSTFLSKGVQTVKRRIANILSPSFHKGGWLILAFSLIISVFAGCENAGNYSIIGGADGPTAVFVSDSPASDLYKLKTPYIGNASAAENVVKALIADGRCEWKGMELQTVSEPYGLILTYELKENESACVPADPFDINAPLFFALIDNLGTLTVNIEGPLDNASKTYTRKDFDAAYDRPISEYAQTEEGFAELYAICSAQNSIDEAISNAILTSNDSLYFHGEFRAEAHITLGSTALANGSAEYYVLARYSEFGFENGVFTTVSGSGIIPVRITFDENLNLTEYKEPIDGSYYIESIKEMYPEAFVSPRVLNQDDKDREYCDTLLKEQAKAYLKKIGRDAQVLDYGEFDHPLLTDSGVSVEVSNLLSENRNLALYPYWIGNLELIENGVRYVYSLDLKSSSIIYTKTEYDTGKTVESFTFDAKTGEAV